MKRSYYIISLLGLGLLSCTPDMNDNLSPLIILGNGNLGKSFSGHYVSYDSGIDTHSNSYWYACRPYEFSYAPKSRAEVDALWESFTYGELSTKATPEEAFAYERIQERMLPLSEQFKQYRNQLIGSNNYIDKTAVAAFICAYVTGTPTITADDTLFGLPAGTDLSDYFCFGDRNIIGVTGTDYMMVERADIVNDYQKASEYFIEDRMLPSILYLSTVGIPEEIIPPTSHNPYGDVIRVSVTIPVLLERYWEWCKALYNNPNAEEEFLSGDISIVLSFTKKP